MRKVWIAAALTAIIFIGSYFYMNYLENVCAQMTGYIDSAYSHALGGDALKYIDSADVVLEKCTAVLCIFIDQEFINEVEDGIILCRELNKLGDTDELLRELVVLREKVNHLKQSEEFDLKRIL